MARDPMMEGFIVAASTITGMLAFFSPGIAMLVAGSTVRFAPYNYAFGLTSCVLWIAVGLHHGRTALWRLSGFGLVAYAAYLVAFVRNSEPTDPRRRCLLRYVVGGCAAVLLVGAGLGIFGSDAAFDDFCSTVACLASLAPLWNVPAVFRTRSTDSMPSVIVAALGLTNAIVSTVRNTTGAGDIDRNIAIPSGVALVSTLVQVVLHVGCWCLPRPLVAPPAVDDTPLLQNQNEDGGSGHENDANATVDGRQSPIQDNARETRVDVATLENNLAIKNLTLPEDGQHGREEVAAHKDGEIVDSSNLQLPQEGQHGLEVVTDHNDDEIIDSSNLQLPQDGQRGLEVVADHNDDEIVDSSNLQLSQDGQEDIGHPNHAKIVGSNNLPLPQDGQEDIGHPNHAKIVGSNNLPLPQDGQEDIGHPNHAKIVGSNNLPLPQDGQEEEQQEKA